MNRIVSQISMGWSSRKSIVAERFIRTLKSKIYKNWQQMMVNLILVISISLWISKWIQ